MSKAPRESLARHLLIALVVAVLIYLVSFGFIQRARTRGGPWELTFASDSSGRPSLRIDQPQMQLGDVRIQFPEAQVKTSNLAQTLVFDQPITNVPFGKVIYFDTTFLPGAIVLELFGHEVQLLPRVLLVDRREVPWQSAMRLELKPASSAPPP